MITEKHEPRRWCRKTPPPPLGQFLPCQKLPLIRRFHYPSEKPSNPHWSILQLKTKKHPIRRFHTPHKKKQTNPHFTTQNKKTSHPSVPHPHTIKKKKSTLVGHLTLLDQVYVVILPLIICCSWSSPKLNDFFPHFFDPRPLCFARRSRMIYCVDHRAPSLNPFCTTL